MWCPWSWGRVSALQSWGPEFESLERVSTLGFFIGPHIWREYWGSSQEAESREISINCQNLFLNRCKINMFKPKVWIVWWWVKWTKLVKIKIHDGKSRKHRGKRRKCWLPAFSPFPTMFPKHLFPGMSKLSLCCKKLSLNLWNQATLSCAGHVLWRLGLSYLMYHDQHSGLVVSASTGGRGFDPHPQQTRVL